jgi:hypothetical protein
MKDVPSGGRALRFAPLAGALALALATHASLAAAAASPSAQPGTSLNRADAYALRLQMRQARNLAPAAAPSAAPVRVGSTLAVTSCADDTDPGTLRNVLATAGEGDTIDLSQLTCSTITLTQGLLDLSVLGPHQIKDLTIQGPGRDKLAIDGNGDRVLSHGDFRVGLGTLVLKDLTIRNGNYTHGLSSCVHSTGNVTLDHVTITDCHASGGGPLTFGGATDISGKLTMRSSTISASSSSAAGDNVAIGGAAYVAGDAELIDSTISGNSVTAVSQGDGQLYTTAGGGLYLRGGLTMTNSTISGNSVEATGADQASPGGGIFVRAATQISGSTIEGNRADGDGGGIFKAVFSHYGDPGMAFAISNSTVSGNSARSGGGIGSSRPLDLANSTVAFNTGAVGAGGIMFVLDGVTYSEGTLNLQSSIVASNSVGDASTHAKDLGTDGALTVSGANDLVMDADATITLPAGTLAADPLLFPLAYNGGATRTHALGAGSPALDAGSNAAQLDFDQRGSNFARASGAAPDIGAFEAQRPDTSDTIFKDGFENAAPTGPVEYLYDDGDASADGGNIGPPSSFSPDMLWGNYYTVQPGGDFITRISIAFGPTFPSLQNGPVTFWLLEDADADGDPRNAHVVASVPGTPDVFNNNFFSVDIPPTWVHGAFFVGASAKLRGGQDKPARIDGAGPADTSWFFYAPDIPTIIDNLAAAPYGVRVSEAGLARPGSFMVRATGQSAH